MSLSLLNKYLLCIFLFPLLFTGCATLEKTPRQEPTSDDSSAQCREIFDVGSGNEMIQTGSEELTNGWAYQFTNDGVSATDPALKESILVVELQGTSEPKRLAHIFPKNCQELRFEQQRKDGYMTWTDILACPQYGTDKGKGILVVDKSIQGSTEFYGATLYKWISAYTGKVIDYKELPLSSREVEMVDHFLKETKITTSP